MSSKNRTLKVALFLPFFLLSSCGTFYNSHWPEGAPLRSEYLAHYADSINLQAYQSEKEYLMWVSRFYEGFNIIPGWLEITEKVLEETPSQEAASVEDRMFELGKRISQEWAKDNNLRVINSKMANIWRDAFLESIDLDDLPNYLAMLEVDVSELLSGNLNEEDIYFERYYEDSFDF